ncbi:RNA recognition motif domain-containing protein [Spirochaeta cellobiosiphila]|uniref:RNA recognition motif domain-containing protein n=1 Tax=Spirochaeta cellobiosiphila TaxID=504483 RepID=UPI000414CB0C|nr:RNA-binding protein [Spirochaeta cellobiosiphila]
MKNIYVGNIAYGASEEDLRDAFSEYGDVASVKIIMDRDTGRSKGFGFVEMETEEAAASAIEALNGAELIGRPLKVNEARGPQPRPRERY